MQRFIPRSLLAAVVALTATACAAGMEDVAGVAPDGTSGGRYRVLVPALEVQDGVAPRVGETVANQLRSHIAGMDRHTAVPERQLRGAMRQHDVQHLDEITARQLAQVINAQMVTWGTIEQTAAGLQANLRLVDVASGDEIDLEPVTAADPRALADAVFQSFDAKIEGILQAGFGSDYLASEQYEQALENFERALAVVPQSTQALYGKGTALFHLGNYEEALATYRELLEVDPTHQDGLLSAGLAASRQGQGDEALGYYNRYLELNPGDVQVRMAVAGQIAETDDFVSAYYVLQPAMQEEAENIDFQQYLAGVATRAGQAVQEEQQDRAAARAYFQTALQAYERVFDARGDELEPSIVRQMVAVNLALDRTDEALRVARRGTERFADDAATWLLFGNALRQAGQHGEAAQAYSRVIELDPDTEGVFVLRGLARMEIGQRDAGVQDLERAAERGDRDRVAAVLYNQAARAVQANNFGEAARMAELTQRYATTGEMRSNASYIRGVAIYRQAEAIARANTQGRSAEAQRALGLFREALTHLQASQHPQAAQVVSAARQYIENQEAIIAAARGR